MNPTCSPDRPTRVGRGCGIDGRRVAGIPPRLWTETTQVQLLPAQLARGGDPMPSHPTGDPLLKGAQWRAIRDHWIRRREPCHLCGSPLDYRVGATGPNAFECGHIVGRDEARTLGWTRQQINTIGNTRPECRRCNRSRGARYRNAKHRGRAPRRALEADEW